VKGRWPRNQQRVLITKKADYEKKVQRKRVSCTETKRFSQTEAIVQWVSMVEEGREENARQRAGRGRFWVVAAGKGER
jgi:hypothetical protein